MNIQGIHITRTMVDVEVSAGTIIESTIRLFDKFHGNRPAEDCYIDTNGDWYVYSYTHPHKGEDFYKKLRPATEEELRLERIRKELWQLRNFNESV